MNLLRKDAGLKLLAMVVAVVLWAFVSVTEQPLNPQTLLHLNAPIEVEGAGPNIVVNGPPDEVAVTLRGEARRINSVRKLSATVDVTGLDPGIYTLPVRVFNPGGTDVVEQEPALVTLELARRTTRLVPVEIEVVGSSAPGTRLASEPTVQPPSVKISGPERQVDRVQKVIGQFLLSGENAPISQRVRDLRAVDEGGQVVPRVEVSNTEVLASLDILPSKSVIHVPVLLDNMKAANVEARVEPYLVAIEPEEGAPVPNGVHILPLDVGVVSGPTTKVATLQAPPGCTILGEPTVKISLFPKRPQAATPSPSPTQRQTASPSRNSPTPAPGT